jgi:hypothetical protein
VVDCWHAGQVKGLGLGGVSAEGACALGRPAMGYVREQLRGRLAREISPPVPALAAPDQPPPAKRAVPGADHDARRRPSGGLSCWATVRPVRVASGRPFDHRGDPAPTPALRADGGPEQRRPCGTAATPTAAGNSAHLRRPSVWLAASQLAVLPGGSGVRRERRRRQRAYPLLRNSWTGSSHSPAKLAKPAAQRAARCGDAVSSQFARHGRFVETPAFLSGADPDLTPGGEVS